MHSFIPCIVFPRSMEMIRGNIFPMSSCTSPGLVHREDAQVLTAWVRNWAVPLKRAHHALWWPPRMGLQGAVGGVWGMQVGSSWPGTILLLLDVYIAFSLHQKMILVSEKPCRKMQLSREVGTCRHCWKRLLWPQTRLSCLGCLLFYCWCSPTPQPKRWFPNSYGFSDCLNWARDSLHAGKDVLLFFCSLTFLSGIRV